MSSFEMKLDIKSKKVCASKREEKTRAISLLFFLKLVATLKAKDSKELAEKGR